MKNREIKHNDLINDMNYDPDTGLFTWKTPGKARQMGRVLGTNDGEGWLQLQYQQKKVRLNVLAYFYMTGQWPDGLVDHINKDKTDNRWENLRVVTASQSQMNRGMHVTNKSGYKNISRKKNKDLWVVQIYKDRKKVVEKCFKHIDEAVAYRDEMLPLIHGEHASK